MKVLRAIDSAWRVVAVSLLVAVLTLLGYLSRFVIGVLAILAVILTTLTILIAPKPAHEHESTSA